MPDKCRNKAKTYLPAVTFIVEDNDDLEVTLHSPEVLLVGK